MYKKQVIIQEIKELNPKYKVNVSKLVVMPISDLLRDKNKAIQLNHMVHEAQRLQRWWREKLLTKKRGYRPIGILEIIRKIDQIRTIQAWWRGLIETKKIRSVFLEKGRARIIISKYVRKFKQRNHERKLVEMEESFKFFDVMRNKVLIDSQIIIARVWRRYIERKK